MNLAVYTVCKFHEDGEGFVNTGDEVRAPFQCYGDTSSMGWHPKNLGVSGNKKWGVYRLVIDR